MPIQEKRILLVDKLHAIFKKQMELIGYHVDERLDMSYEQALCLINSYNGLVLRSRFAVTRELLNAGKHLSFIARAGAGMDDIDVDYARLKGIACFNAPEGNSDAVGEHALGMLLALMNNLKKGDNEICSGIWNREGNRGYELKEKVVGLIGYGHMGKSFARKLFGLEVKVIAYDKYLNDFSDTYAQEVSMDEIFKFSDIVSLHIPLTEETKHLLDDAFFNRFQKPIFLINTARGAILHTPALLNAIQLGSVLGAGLDVLEIEKFPDLKAQIWYNELISRSNILLSPHVAGWTFDSYRKISEVLAQKVKNFLAPFS